MERTIYTRINEELTPSEAGEFVLFGSYPQTRVTNEALISELCSLAGELPKNGSNMGWTSYKYYIFDENDTDFMWYQDVKYGGVAYRGVYFTDYKPNDTMNTSEENRQEENGYTKGTVYWFAFEPLKWRILGELDGKAWIITDMCIDSQAYRNVVWQNSYVKSSIRQWLNSDFLSSAFTESERESVSRETVTNEMEDEDISDGDIPGSDTHDLIHLLSIHEAADNIPKEKLAGFATDYAKSQGIFMYKEGGNSMWWLRTPYYSIESWAQIVCANKYCYFNSKEISSTETGVRPALWLKL